MAAVRLHGCHRKAFNLYVQHTAPVRPTLSVSPAEHKTAESRERPSERVVKARGRNVKLDKPGAARVVGSVGYGENTDRVGGSAGPERYAGVAGEDIRASLDLRRATAASSKEAPHALRRRACHRKTAGSPAVCLAALIDLAVYSPRRAAALSNYN